MHAARLDIERAVDAVKGQLPASWCAELHLCRVCGCRELVVRDTEHLCSRHRARKYHHRNVTKRRMAKALAHTLTQAPLLPPAKRLKTCHVPLMMPLLPVVPSLPPLPPFPLVIAPKQPAAFVVCMPRPEASCVPGAVGELFKQHCHAVRTPCAWTGVRINQTRMSMRIISIDYSSTVPNPNQVLEKNCTLVLFGQQKQQQQQHAAGLMANSIRLSEFVTYAMHFIAAVPAPDGIIGLTLRETPQFAQCGIVVLAVNLRCVAVPLQRRFEKSDVLLCLFQSVADKDAQLRRVCEQLQN